MRNSATPPPPLSCSTTTVVITAQMPSAGPTRAKFEALPGKFEKGCVELRASEFEREDATQALASLFKDLDLMTHADVFIGSMSALSKLAATLAPIQTVRVMAITEGDDPTTSLAGLRGVANVVELCDDGTFDVPYFHWIWRRRGGAYGAPVRREAHRRSMACGEEQRKVAGFMAKSKFALLRRWLRDPHQDAEWRTAVGDALRPPKISRVGLDVRTMRDRGGIRAWDAELIIRKTRGQSILMPELTSLAVLCACGEWWHDAVDTATGAPLMGPPATPPTITEAAVHALLPVSMRVPMELMRKDVARLLGRDSKSVGSRSQMKGDQKAAERRSKKLLAHEAGPLPLCCVARWMSTDPYVRLRIMLSIAFDGVAPAGVSDPIESERLAHASASANMQPAAARAREQMLLKVATPRGAAQTIALEWLIEAAEVPMAPFEDETDSIQWHGDLLRTHYEWTILQVRYYSLLSLPLSFARALSPAASAHTPPPSLPCTPSCHSPATGARAAAWENDRRDADSRPSYVVVERPDWLRDHSSRRDRSHLTPLHTSRSYRRVAVRVRDID